MKYEILDKTSQFSGKFIDVYKTIFKNENITTHKTPISAVI